MVIHGKQIKEFQLLEHINNGEKLQYLTTPQNPGLTLTKKNANVLYFQWFS